MTDVSDLTFPVSVWSSATSSFIDQRNYRWLCVSRKDEVQGNFWIKRCSLVSSGSVLLTQSPMAHGKSSPALCPCLLWGVPASARAADMWQLQTGVSNAVCSMVQEAWGLTVILKFTLRPKPRFLISRKKKSFFLTDGCVAGSFLISPKSEADVSPHGKQEKLCLEKVLVVVFLTQGSLPMIALDLPCQGSPWQACLEL